MADSTGEQAIEACFRAFIEAFNSADPLAVAGLVAFPYVTGNAGQALNMVPDETAGRATFESGFRHMKALGWARTRIDRLEAARAGGDTGVISTDFSRYREDGSRLDGGSGHYIARRIDGQWKIAAAIFSDNGLLNPRK